MSGGKKSKSTQTLLGIARPDPGTSSWRGPAETRYAAWRREQQHRKRMLRDARGAVGAASRVVLPELSYRRASSTDGEGI
jgi:hypothetical protein